MVLFKPKAIRIVVIGFIFLISLFFLNLIPEKPILAESLSSSGDEQIFPKDDSVNDLSFMEFKLNLLKAIAKKDAEYIYSVITPNIKLSFGGQDGLTGMEVLWELKTNPESKFWPVLERIIKLGCVSKETSSGKWFWAPYTYAQFNGEPYQSLIVTGNSVNLRAKPDLKAKVLRKLDYAVVQIANPVKYNPPTPWIQVQTPSGQTGYIASQYLISPLDYRAAFTKIDGAWKMVFLVNGD